MRQALVHILLCACVIFSSVACAADVIKVAVATNFSSTLHKISESFETATGHTVKISSASSGKHYAQIKQGAPFDVFLSADQRRPNMLLKEGFAKLGGSRTYAIGQLVLWTNQEFDNDLSMQTLQRPWVKRIAIANPVFAPYGQAAVEILQGAGLWDELEPKVVRGENIGQAFQFVASRNAELGLLALSQTKVFEGGRVWIVPGNLYAPLRQDVIALNDRPISKQFLDFLLSPQAQQIIRESGYKSP